MMPINNTMPLSASVCHPFGVGKVNNDVSLLCAWEQWARQAPPGSGERRDTAVRRLSDCLKRHASSLNLSGLALTALPERFPAGLQCLNLGNNCLQNLPETLPNSLQELSVCDNYLTQLLASFPDGLIKLYANNNQLTYLPETLPDSLQKLFVCGNQLTRLPRRLPVSLTCLGVGRNQLAALPDTMPSSLNQLFVADNQLTRLPDNLPASLYWLNVKSNQLTRLPDNLPASLEWLNVESNQLTRLPDNFSASLRWLYLGHNQLTSIPDNLPNSLELLHVEDNQLTSLPARLPVSLKYLNASNNQLTHLPVTLPRSLITLHVGNNPLDSDYQARNDFLAKLMCWHEGIDIARWQSIYTEPHAGDFTTFLDKLHQGNNRSSAALRGQVGRWLDYLAQDGHGELRGKTFVLANEAMASCVDRASYYFTLMQILQIEHQLLRCDVSPEEVVKAIQGNFRLQILNGIAARQVAARRAASPGFAEDLEIYLAYQYKLREPLALPVYAELQFSEIAGLTDEDIRQAKETVDKAEKADFMHYWLTKSALWEAILTKWDGAKKAAADDQYVEDINEDNCKFKAEVDKRLRDRGIAVNDADARRAVSDQLADELLYAQRYQLTQEYLAEKQALSLLEQCHSATL